MIEEDDVDLEEEEEEDYRSENRRKASVVFSVIASVLSGEFLNTR